MTKRRQTKLSRSKRVNIRHRYRQITWYKGKIIKNVAWHPPKYRYMWRTTVAINYAWHRKYYSYKVTVYAKDRKRLPSQGDIETVARARFEQLRGYTVEELADTGDQIRIGYEKPTKVKLDKTVVDTTTYEDEYLRDKRVFLGNTGLLKGIWQKIRGKFR